MTENMKKHVFSPCSRPPAGGVSEVKIHVFSYFPASNRLNIFFLIKKYEILICKEKCLTKYIFHLTQREMCKKWI